LGALNAGGVGTNRDSGLIAGYQSIAGRGSNSCDGRPYSLSHRRRRISECLFITACSMDEYAKDKRRKQNLTVCSSKSEAEVSNNKDGAPGIVLLKLTTDRHEALRGLFVTAELFVTQYRHVTDRWTDMLPMASTVELDK